MFGIQSSPYLLSLAPGEVFRLPQASHSVQVLSGIAWLTVAGEDIILANHEVASLLSSQNVALISALSEQPLLLKIL